MLGQLFPVKVEEPFSIGLHCCWIPRCNVIGKLCPILYPNQTSEEVIKLNILIKRSPPKI